SEGVELLEQLPGVGVPGLDVGRVLGVALDAPGADRDDRGQARGYEVAEQLELELLERDPRLVAVDRDPRGSEEVFAGTPSQERGETDGEVRSLRAEADVAEVDDRGDPAPVIEQDVVQVQVSVDDLRAQHRPPRRHALLEAVEDVLDQSAPRLVVDRGGERPQLGGALKMPEQVSARRRVEEAAQGEVQPRVRGA